MEVIVSVIVPCYNYGHFLTETLDSVYLQTFRFWECIIIDDGSTDNTAEVAQSYSSKDSRFRYFYQENKGLSAARNAGIKKAQGKFIQLLDADDIIEIDKLKVQSKFLDENQGVHIVFSQAVYFNDKEQAANYTPCPYPNEIQDYSILLHDFKHAMVIKNRLAPCSPLIRRSVFDDVGVFDETLFSLEDWDFWLRCCNMKVDFSFSSANQTRALMRQSPNSMRKNVWKMAFYEYLVRVRLNISDRTLRQVNKRLMRDRLKTFLYAVLNNERKIELIQQLISETNNHKLKVLLHLQKHTPSKWHSKIVWILFESPINVLKKKLNVTK